MNQYLYARHLSNLLPKKAKISDRINQLHHVISVCLKQFKDRNCHFDFNCKAGFYANKDSFIYEHFENALSP